jgi:hypothetical protein
VGFCARDSVPIRGSLLEEDDHDGALGCLAGLSRPTFHCDECIRIMGTSTNKVQKNLIFFHPTLFVYKILRLNSL